MKHSSPVRAVGLFLRAGGILLAGCSGDRVPRDVAPLPEGGVDAEDPPQSCPFPIPPASECGSVPSYRETVAPLVELRCGPCHAPSQIEAAFPLVSYPVLAGPSQRQDILEKVSQCIMPPPEARPLTSEERSTLLRWLSCDAPNN